MKFKFKRKLKLLSICIKQNEQSLQKYFNKSVVCKVEGFKFGYIYICFVTPKNEVENCRSDFFRIALDK